MNFIERALYRAVQKAATVAGNKLFQSQYFGLANGQSIAMDDDAQEYIDKGFTHNAQMYALTSYVAEKGAAIPYRVVMQTPEGEYEDAETAEADAIRELLRKPNGNQSYREFMEQALGFLTVTGDLYWYAPRMEGGPNKGRALELHTAASPYMEIVSGGRFEPIRGYRFVQGMYSKEMDVEDVMHVRKMNLDFNMGSEFYGMSPWKPGRSLLTKANSAQDAQKFLYENRGAVGLVSGGGKTPFTEQQAVALDDAWTRKYGRTQATGKPVFTEANVQWQSIVMSARDLGFNEDHLQTLRDMCAIMHLPSQLFGDPDNKTYSNYAEARKASYTDAICPPVNAVWDEFNQWIVPSYSDNLKVVPDLKDIPELQPDKAKASEVMERALRNGAATPNEFRAAIGLPLSEDPNADKMFMTAGLMPADMSEEDLDAAAEKALNRLNVRDYR